MHDEILDFIVYNAFNGNGDIIGSDDFGVSVAWIDLQDYLDESFLPKYEDSKYPGPLSLEERSRIAIEYAGNRYALAFIWSSGNREIDSFDSQSEMMERYRAWEKEWNEWNDDDDENEGE
jgi:hypothetical protein